MRKTILNLGKVLEKQEQRKVNGGVLTQNCPSGGRALIACIGGSLKGFCAGGVVLSLGPCQ
ncbi:hypothetical protein [uncultured Tenacibaculum sp.]|uniref:hypothetical protein n=1 Tax=uncultured Tenacibaculum sp. TaxID=174713 RepID=UPI0026166B65|nr:hypothetical protein [uncultured Tenacibaculum sp.]